MDLSKNLTSDFICANLQGKTKFDIIEELLDLLHKKDRLTDRDTALQDVLDREGYLSTGLENGLAIPHAKTDGVKQLEIVFGLKKEGVDFESLDGKAATLIFLVLSPRNTSGPHIQTLAVISRNLKEKNIRQALLAAKDQQQLENIFQTDFAY